jgi:hypothetical protein
MDHPILKAHVGGRDRRVREIDTVLLAEAADALRAVLGRYTITMPDVVAASEVAQDLRQWAVDLERASRCAQEAAAPSALRRV